VMVDKPSQIKSADAITRDDAARVIPLSERFQPDSDDIRFQREAGIDDTVVRESRILNAMKDAGNYRAFVDMMLVDKNRLEIGQTFREVSAAETNPVKAAMRMMDIASERGWDKAASMLYQRVSPQELMDLTSDANAKIAEVIRATKSTSLRSDVIKPMTWMDKAKRLGREFAGMGKRTDAVLRGLSSELAEAHDQLLNQALQTKDSVLSRWQGMAESAKEFRAIDNNRRVTIEIGGRTVETSEATKMTLATQAIAAGFGGYVKRTQQSEALKRSLVGWERKDAPRVASQLEFDQGGDVSRVVSVSPPVKTTDKNGKTVWVYEDMERLVADLTPQELAAAKAIAKLTNNMGDEIFAEFARANPEKSQADIAKMRREFYLTVMRDASLADKETAENLRRLERQGFISMLDPENSRFLEKLTGGTKVPLLITDYRDVLNRHMKQAADYVGANPYARWMKGTLLSGEAMKAIGEKDPVALTLLQEHSETIGAFLDPRLDPAGKAIGMVLRNASRARLLGWAIAKQPASVFNYQAFFSRDEFNAGMVMREGATKQLIANVKKHTPYLANRGQTKGGVYDALLAIDGEGSGRWITGDTSLTSKVDDTLHRALRAGDAMAVDRSIPMAKARVDKTWTGAKNTPQYYAEIGRVASIATQKTQVATDDLNRSLLGRSKDIWKRTFNYMYGAREASYSLLTGSLAEYRNAKTDFERQAARTKMVETAVAVMIQQAATIAILNELKKEFEDKAIGRDPRKIQERVMDFGVNMLESNISYIPLGGMMSAGVGSVITRNPSLAAFKRQQAGLSHPVSGVIQNMFGAFGHVRTFYEHQQKANDPKVTYARRKQYERMAERAAYRSADSAFRFSSELLGVPADKAWLLFSRRRQQQLQ